MDEAAKRGPDNRADDRYEDYVRPTSLPGRYKGHDQNQPTAPEPARDVASCLRRLQSAHLVNPGPKRRSSSSSKRSSSRRVQPCAATNRR